MKLVLFCYFIIVVHSPTYVIAEIVITDEAHAGQLIIDLSTKTVFSQQVTNAKSLFRLISTGPFMNYLKIESDTGKLFANKKIDRDSLCKEIDVCCTFERICIIPISVALMTTSKITVEPFTHQIPIHIHDVNDHTPTFVPSNVSLSIAESSPMSTTFLLPVAVDQDSRDYSVKAYRLMSHDQGDIFGLDTQLVDNKLAAYLRLRQKLDREQTDKYRLTVIAFDGGEPSLTGTLEIFVTVTDVNDNPPVFENSRNEVSVKESLLLREPIAQMVATDKDIAENAEVFYKLDASMSSVGSMDLFRIDIRSGSVYLTSVLDYERLQSYKLIVLASNRESGMPTATASLTVNVINTNDEKPTIIIDYLSNRQHAIISENVAAPLFVAIISVTDKDIGISGKVICNLNNHQDIFDLRQSSQDQFKVYTRQQFDREAITRYSLIVLCQDQGVPALSTESQIIIIVLDENDNSPEIKSSSVCRIRENKVAGTVVARTNAVDKDDGLNSQLTYAITDSNNIISSYIRVDSQTGVIRTVQVIDKESKNPSLSTLDFLLTVSDNGTPKLTTSMSMHLIIEDENDNEPQFSQAVFRFSIAENELPQYRLGQIEVTDADEVGTLRLSLSYNKKSYRKCPFSLTKENSIYWLMTTKSLDWEEEPLHELIVVATDGSGFKSHTSSATVFVTVIDMNDHKPLFIFPRPVNNTWHLVSYRNKPGFVIITVSATDKDSPAAGNGRFHFSITSDPASLFSIDPNLGRIGIQRQTVISDIGDHLILIKAEDHGSPPLSSEMKIKIRVTDASVFQNEKSKDNDGSNFSINDPEKGFFTDKEAILIFGLVFVLLILTITICFILYVRHMKGWLQFLPDIIGLCHLREHHSKNDHYRKDEAFMMHNTESNNLHCADYPTQKFMVSFPPSYCQTPEPLIKNSRDCYEVLKIGANTSPLKLIPGQSYNDLVTATMMPQYNDSNYRTIHQYGSEFPISNYNFKSKSLKPMPASNWSPNCQSEKVGNLQTASINLQNSYAVSFPSEESTFV